MGHIAADPEILSSGGGRERYHENISKDNPSGILVINNELKNESNDRELKK